MRKVIHIAVAVAATLALAACSSDTAGDVEDSLDDVANTSADVTTTLADVTTTLAEGAEPIIDDVAAAVTQVQSEMITLTNMIRNSDAASDLEQGVNDLQTQLNTSLVDLLAGNEVDVDAVRSALESFSDELEAAGDAVDDDIRAAWDSIRTQVEALIS